MSVEADDKETRDSGAEVTWIKRIEEIGAKSTANNSLVWFIKAAKCH